jgi:hypothetical protein
MSCSKSLGGSVYQAMGAVTTVAVLWMGSYFWNLFGLSHAIPFGGRQIVLGRDWLTVRNTASRHGVLIPLPEFRDNGT